MQIVEQEIAHTIEVFRKFQDDPELIATVYSIGEACARALESGHKILIAGNGGSAADAQHIAAEFVSRFTADRAPLPALALTTDTSILTACGNDYGFETVFARQVQALGSKGDVFIGISTSGRSPNVIRAMETARSKRMITVALTGRKPTDLAQSCDYVARVPSDRTQNVQEVHSMIGHTICAIAERSFLPTNAHYQGSGKA